MAVASSELPSTERRRHYKALLDLGWEGDWGSGEFEGENGNRRIFHGVAICHSIHARFVYRFFSSNFGRLPFYSGTDDTLTPTGSIQVRVKIWG